MKTTKKLGLWNSFAKKTNFLFLGIIYSATAFGHCDSYDGPVIKDDEKALETNNVELVLKWINKDQEDDIEKFFHKTYNLKGGDKEVYAIVEKHFFETLVRLHRETEGTPYTGLRPAGSTKPIIMLTDASTESGSPDDLLLRLNAHIEKVVREKFDKVAQLNSRKDENSKNGREYVAAYVDYTHTVEGIHDILEHTGDPADNNH